MYAKIPIKDIKKMTLVQTNGKKTAAQVKTQYGCQYVLNCSIYDFDTFEPQTPTKADGKVLKTSKDGYWSYAWNRGSDFQMVHSFDMNLWTNLFSCSAFLKDGQNTIFKYNDDMKGIRGRSAVGIDADNNLVLFCSKDGSSLAMNPERLRDYMKNTLGCVSGIMLDGGGSTNFICPEGKITTSRKVANYLCVWVDDPVSEVKPTVTSKVTCPYKTPTTSVKNGSKGEGARWTQWYLNAVDDAGLVVDGIFGAKSVAALKKFQKEHGLDDDGICGKATRAALTEAYKKL